MHYVVVHNAASGSALSETELAQLFADAGVSVAAFIAIDDDFAATLAPYIKQGATIVAIGGDGTISATADLVAGTSASLLPLPGGTLNHFTKDLGVVQDLQAAIAGIPTATCRQIDVGRVNNIVFVNNSSIGVYPSVLAQRPKYEATLGKWPAVAIATVKTFIRWPLLNVTIDNETFTTPFVFVGNNTYDLNDIGVVSRTTLDEGSLCVFIAKTQSRRALFLVGLRSLVGAHRSSGNFEVRSMKRLTIASSRSQLRVSRDGELSSVTTPLIYECDAATLSVWLVQS